MNASEETLTGISSELLYYSSSSVPLCPNDQRLVFEGVGW